MKNWYMLTLVGNDRTGIVARVTNTLFENNCDLGETSMLRLGGNFTIMMMVSADSTAEQLKQMLLKISEELKLHVHVDQIEGRLHEHHIPNVLVTVAGADRGGIIAQVSQKLYDCGFDILNLDSDVAGTNENPIYIMRIEGLVKESIESVQSALKDLQDNGIDITVQAIDTLIG